MSSSLPLNASPEFWDWLPSNRKELIGQLANWPMGPVREKLIASGHSTDENVNNHILWYKQFMSFQIVRAGVRCGMYSDVVDGVWHQHILFTKDYQSFCSSLFGHFIHHDPCNIMDLSSSALDEYGIWLTDYEAAYGHMPPDLADELKVAIRAKGPKCINHPHPDPTTYKCGSR